MRKLKTFILFILLAVFLAAAVFVPPTVSKIKDRMLIGKVTTQELKPIASPNATDMTIADKFSLINGYYMGEDRFVMVSQDQRLGYLQNEQDISKIAAAELGKLTENGICPDLNFDQSYSLSDCTLKSFTNVNQPSLSVQVWEVVFTSGKNNISLMIDKETHLVYQFSVWVEDPLPQMNLVTVSENYAKYLGIKWDTEAAFEKKRALQRSSENGRILYEFMEPGGGNGYSVIIISEARDNKSL